MHRMMSLYHDACFICCYAFDDWYHKGLNHGRAPHLVLLGFGMVPQILQVGSYVRVAEFAVRFAII